MIESVITRRSAEEMDLKKGDSFTAVVKASERFELEAWKRTA